MSAGSCRTMTGWLALLVAFGGTLAITACRGTEAETAGSALETAAVRRINLEVKAEATGAIQPIRTVEVKSKASGEVLRLHGETGMNVTKGTLLAEIDPRDVRNAYQQAEADMDVAQARLKASQTGHERSVQLREANIITAQELESAELDLANQKAAHFRARTNLDLAEQRLNDVRIAAPIDGTIISRTVEEGTIIQSGSSSVSGGTALFTMADLAQMQVSALIAEIDIGRVSAGQPVSVTVDAFPDRPFMGSVQKIEPQAKVEQNVTMFPVIVVLDNAEGLLKPGMSARVEVEIMEKPGVLGVPNDAVVNMSDALAAGMVLGMSEEAVTQALEAARAAGRTPPARGVGEAAETATADSTSPAADPGAANRRAGAGGQRAGADGTAPVQRPGADGAAPGQAGQRGQITPEMRERFAAMRGRRAEAGGNDETRPGVVFVNGPAGPELRMVTFGASDWDNTEVVSGLEEGEAVIIISAIRLQQQQQQFEERMRERMGGGGIVPGGGMGGGRGR
ncbi:MAG: efflux RND transporter periplasmic adaptor subunit [Gemmatimonadota bacterium]